MLMGEIYRCPNCELEGEARKRVKSSVKTTVVILLIASLFYPWLFIISIPALLLAPLFGSEKICSKCGWQHIVPTGKQAPTQGSQPVSPLFAAVMIIAAIAAFVWLGISKMP